MNVWTRERLREVPDDGVARISSAVSNRLCKWRSFFAGWQTGTRPADDPELRAIKHHRELSILLRAEVSAITGLLIEKGVFTAREFTEAMIIECQQLMSDYEQTYPGIKAEEDGLEYSMPLAAETLRKMGFPP